MHDDPSSQDPLGGLASYLTLYSDHLSLLWWQWVDDIYIKYPIPGRDGDWHGQARGLECGGPGRPPASAPGCVYPEGVAGYEAAIHAHAFAIVSLFGNHNMDSRDRDILAAVESTRGYAQVSDEGSAPTFIYAPDYPAWERANPAAAAAVGATRRLPTQAAGDPVMPERPDWEKPSGALNGAAG